LSLSDVYKMLQRFLEENIRIGGPQKSANDGAKEFVVGIPAEKVKKDCLEVPLRLFQYVHHNNPDVFNFCNLIELIKDNFVLFVVFVEVFDNSCILVIFDVIFLEKGFLIIDEVP